MTATATDRVFEVPIQGMNCANCALGVEKHLRARGCAGAKVSIATESAFIPVGSGWSRSDVAREVQSLGYRTDLPRTNTPRAGAHSSDEPDSPMVAKTFLSVLYRWLEGGWAVLVAAIVTAPFLAHMFMHVPYVHDPLVQAALASIACFIGLVQFLPAAHSSLKTRLPNMEVLISIGIIASLGYSFYGWAIGQPESFAFFESAATISSLVLIGRWLERRVSSQTNRTLADLIELQPHTAQRIVGNSQEVVETRTLVVGDRIALNKGDRVPVDSQILSGSLVLNEAIATGEATPVTRSNGMQLLAGTVILDGNAQASVQRIEADSFVSSMVTLVRRAQSEKAPIARMADRVAAVFVPLILALSTITVLGCLAFGLPFSEALTRGIAVLVISCPCALGLATPAAVLIGMGRAAKRNVLFRSGEAIETLARVRSVAFDKTGTLTERALEVRLLSSGVIDEGVLLASVKALEMRSSHPIASAITEKLAAVTPAPFVSIIEETGRGMRGRDVSGAEWFIGKSELGVEGSGGAATQITRDGVVVGTLEVEERLRPGATVAIEYFTSQGIPVSIVSGDHLSRVAALTLPSAVKRYGSQSPQDKQATVAALAKPSLFVGDGVNDAPVLASAQLGVSLSDGSAVAQSTSGVVLIGANLGALVTAHRVARATLTTIRQNLFWALSYNVVAIPIAMAGLLSPAWAALTMAFSDLVLVVNSLRLQAKRIP